MNGSSLIIESAFYNKKDVTSIVEELIFNNSLYFIADNGVFGDPEPYKPKKLTITYKLNSRKRILEVKENEYVKINFIPTDRLGIWYTNNCKTKPNIINRSFVKIAENISKKYEMKHSNEDIFNIAKSPQFQESVIELLQRRKNER